jgi:hypothetical protein
MEIVEELHQSTEGKVKGSQSQNSRDVGSVDDKRIKGDGKDSRNCYQPSVFQTSKNYDLKSISAPSLSPDRVLVLARYPRIRV